MIVALMTLETTLKAASAQRTPTPSTTEGTPSPSAADAAAGVKRIAGTVALAASMAVPRSWLGVSGAGAGAPTKARLRKAVQNARTTQTVASLVRAITSISPVTSNNADHVQH